MSHAEPAEGPALLVTVLDDAEAAVAHRCGADLLDVKDPDRGALGAAPAETVRRVAARRDRSGQASGRRIPVSAALGDRPDAPGLPEALVRRIRSGADVVKVGMLGITGTASAVAALRPLLRAARDEDPRVRVVAATFADLPARDTLPAMALLDAAAEAGADGCLLDTATKDGRALTGHLGPEALHAIVREAHGRGLFIALAGSLRVADLGAIRGAAPDLVGVRGACCSGGRSSPLSPAALVAFRRALHGLSAGEADRPVTARDPRPPRAVR